MSAIDDLPPLREVIRGIGCRRKKSLGQNFLLDLNLTGAIARAAGPLEGATVIEVGPGPGGLTRALLARAPAHVIAVERDERCLAGAGGDRAALSRPARRSSRGDALAIDLARASSARRAGARSSPTCPTISAPRC